MPASIHFLAIAPGSLGDVHPMAAIGCELVRRGHEFHLIAGPNAKSLAQRAGFGYDSIYPEQQRARFIRDPDMRRRGRRHLAHLVRPTWNLIQGRDRPGQTVLLALPSAVSARVAQEVLKAPLATVHGIAAMLRSEYFSPGWPLGGGGRSLPLRLLRRAQFAISDLWLTDPILLPELNKLRRENSLAELRRPLHRWAYSPDLNIGLFPEWFAPPQPDWPQNLRIFGFPLFDESGLTELPAALDAFLAAGPSPVAVTAGTGMPMAHQMIQESLEACRTLGLRVLLLSALPDHVPDRLPDNVLYLPYAPFSWAFPRCRAVIHHAGIGTTAHAIAAGIPQIAIPWGHDQPHNAERICQLGIGRRLSRRDVIAPKIAGALAELLADSKAAETCRRYSRLAAQCHAAQSASDAIEEWAKSQLTCSALL